MKPIRNLLAGTVVAAAAVLSAAAGSVAAAADDGTPPEGHHHRWHHGPWHLYAQLGLTDAQKASIKSIMSAAGPQMKSLHEQMQANSLKLRQTAPNDPSYASVVAEVSASAATLSSQRVTQMADVRAQIFNTVLTPAQQAQLTALEAQAPTAGHGAWAGRAHGPAE
jgi:Spy/CpxP family protein refolding chaperone